MGDKYQAKESKGKNKRWDRPGGLQVSVLEVIHCLVIPTFSAESFDCVSTSTISDHSHAWKQAEGNLNLRIHDNYQPIQSRYFPWLR